MFVKFSKQDRPGSHIHGFCVLMGKVLIKERIIVTRWVMWKGMLITLWGVSKQREFPDSEGSGKPPSGSWDLKEEEALTRASGAWEDVPVGGNNLFSGQGWEGSLVCSRNTRMAGMIRGWGVSKKGSKPSGSEAGRGPSGDMNALFAHSP